ncbi:terminase [Schaalia sp. ZJ1691]|uniref:terminase n=1 Tax=Schaalia sp. ZJ1691 TaxID=2709404 RepID=UPI0013ED7493|nr:terminase [Schaalia sp. ZJ1691]
MPGLSDGGVDDLGVPFFGVPDDELTDDEIRLKYAPVVYGPSWRRDEDGSFVLPEHTLGWGIVQWCTEFLEPLDPEQEVFTFTLEQLRLILWWYAVDEDGKFLFPSHGVLQRIKGWGKDPLLAVLCLVEAFGPSQFLGWGGDGEAVGKRRPNALVQIFALKMEQTANTFDMFHQLIGDKLRSQYGVDVRLQIIRGCRNTARIEVKTSSFRSTEGNRATFCVLNETQHWLPSQNGDNLRNTVEGNLSKMRGRSIAITNAYKPGEGSVAEREREAYVKTLEGEIRDSGLFYDSLEAPDHTPLSERVFKIVYSMVRGDSYWCDPESAWTSTMSPTRPTSESRRMFLNQVWQPEDSLYSSAEWKRIERKATLAKGDRVCLGFDGGKSDDSTALVAIRVSDGLMVPLLLEEKPEDMRDRWEVDRGRVDSKVHEVFRDYDVVGFFADVALWESYIADWSLDYGERLIARASERSPIAWDMRSKKRSAMLHEQFMSAILNKRVSHGGPRGLALAFRRHVLNVVRRDTAWGVSFSKPGRESKRKVDMYAAAMLAYGAYQEYQTQVALGALKSKGRQSGAFTRF